MVTTLTVLSAMRRASADPCCPPDQCDYSPKRVAGFLETIRELKGVCSAIEAVRSVHFSTGHRNPDEARVSDLGPGSRSESAARVVADLVRAIQAGQRDPISISKFLCPVMNAAPVDEPAPVRVS